MLLLNMVLLLKQVPLEWRDIITTSIQRLSEVSSLSENGFIIFCIDLFFLYYIHIYSLSTILLAVSVP